MKLLLRGHTERYPVEQLQMQLFGNEPSEFVTEEFEEDGTISSLSRGKLYLTATAKVRYRGKTGFAARRLPLVQADVRRTRRLLQQSYYLAAIQVLDTVPPWGALSGVRPTKLSTKCMLEGGSERAAKKLLEQTYFVTPERSRLCVDASRHTLEAVRLSEPTDLSVYIGIPFCPTRCSYCSFVSESIERFGAFLPPYLAALHREIEYTGKLLRASGYHIRSLYMGGGTPTTLSSAQMQALLAAIHESFDLSRCLEFTVEGGRPDTLDREKLQVIKNGGATRISINPQTMADDVLENVGRKHTSAQTLEAFHQAREVGFEDINMDVITGLPGEEMPQFEHTMDEIRRLAPDSLTVHTLAIKRSSRLNLEKYPLPDGDLTARMVRLGGETARALGMKPYYLYRQKYMAGQQQNVGYATAGNACLYNIDMMEETGSVIAVGAGAISKRVFPDRELRIERAPNVTNVAVYIDRVAEMARRKEHLFHS